MAVRAGLLELPQLGDFGEVLSAAGDFVDRCELPGETDGPAYVAARIHRSLGRPLTDTATAATDRARTVHHVEFDDTPSRPDAGKVLIRRATVGRRVGAMRISTTVVEAAAPGSPVRVRATHATANPSTTLPASASPVGGHGSASPRCAPASISTAPAA